MEDLSIRYHLEHAAVAGNQLQRADALLQLHEPFRQTDGLWLIVSSRAISDDNFLHHVSRCDRRLPPIIFGDQLVLLGVNLDPHQQHKEADGKCLLVSGQPVIMKRQK